MSDSEEAYYRARCFVHGMTDEVLAGGIVTGKKVPHAGHWAPRFLSHPWVEQAETEGWSMELRAPIVRAVAKRIMAKQPHHDITELMPDAKWIEHTRVNAHRYAAARQWRAEIAEKYGTTDAFLDKTKGGKRGSARPLGSVMKDAFGSMQRASPNVKSLHSYPASLAHLTDRSRRMSGDSE